eukprot:6916747-Ditylum_brightwellii.AAC.1
MYLSANPRKRLVNLDILKLVNQTYVGYGSFFDDRIPAGLSFIEKRKRLVSLTEKKSEEKNGMMFNL